MTTVGDTDSTTNILPGAGFWSDGHETCIVVASVGALRTIML